MAPTSASSLSRRRFLRRAAQGTAGTALLLGIPWADVQARAAQFGIVPGTRVDASGQVLAGGGLDTFLGEIFLTPYTFAPRGSASCDGQIIPIQQNTALFALLGTTYGGNGQTTFALPDLRGRLPMHVGQGPGLSIRDLGEQAGSETITMLTSEMPAHSHSGAQIGGGRRVRTPSATAFPASSTEQLLYGEAAGDAMDVTASVGGGQPMNNLPPYLVLNICISLQGIFPQRP